MKNIISKDVMDIIFEEGECPMEERVTIIYRELNSPYNMDLKNEVQRRLNAHRNAEHSDAVYKAWCQTFEEYGFSLDVLFDEQLGEYINNSHSFFRNFESRIKDIIAHIDKAIVRNIEKYEKHILKRIIAEKINRAVN